MSEKLPLSCGGESSYLLHKLGGFAVCVIVAAPMRCVRQGMALGRFVALRMRQRQAVMGALLGLTIGLLPISASGQDALERELDAYARTGCV